MDQLVGYEIVNPVYSVWSESKGCKFGYFVHKAEYTGFDVVNIVCWMVPMAKQVSLIDGWSQKPHQTSCRHCPRA